MHNLRVIVHEIVHILYIFCIKKYMILFLLIDICHASVLYYNGINKSRGNI